MLIYKLNILGQFLTVKGDLSLYNNNIPNLITKNVILSDLRVSEWMEFVKFASLELKLFFSPIKVEVEHWNRLRLVSVIQYYKTDALNF